MKTGNNFVKSPFEYDQSNKFTTLDSSKNKYVPHNNQNNNNNKSSRLGTNEDE